MNIEMDEKQIQIFEWAEQIERQLADVVSRSVRLTDHLGFYCIKVKCERWT